MNNKKKKNANSLSNGRFKSSFTSNQIDKSKELDEMFFQASIDNNSSMINVNNKQPNFDKNNNKDKKNHKKQSRGKDRSWRISGD